MSGSAGGNRIPRSAVEKTVKEYIDKVLNKVPGFKSAKVSGSYNTSDKQDFGDIDLITSFEGEDKKIFKKQLAQYLESLPDNVIVPFKSEKYAGKKTLNTGEIVTILYPISGMPGEFVQIDNIIALSEEEGVFKKTFLDYPAEIQGLILGLVKAVTLEEDPNKIIDKMGIKNIPALEPNQEYEFNLSSVGLTLRIVTLGEDYKQLERTDVWKSSNWGDVKKLLADYNIDQPFKDLVSDLKKLKNPRSKNRIKGIFKSMVSIKSGEVNTPKGDNKQMALDTVATLEGKHNSLVQNLISGLINEKTTKESIVLYPGKFKPPHKGHFEVAKQLLNKADKVEILISGKEVGGITAEQSKAIWELYNELLGGGLNIKIIQGSPVKYVLDTIESNPNNHYIAVYGKGDEERYRNIGKDPRYMNAEVFNGGAISLGDENISATNLRKAMIDKDIQAIKSMLPDGINAKEYIQTLAGQKKLQEVVTEYYNVGSSSPKVYIVNSDGTYKEVSIKLLSKIPNLIYDMGGGETNYYSEENIVIIDNIPVEQFAQRPGEMKDKKIYIEYNLNKPYNFPKANKIIASQLVYNLDNVKSFAATVANSLKDGGTFEFYSDIMSEEDKTFLKYLSSKFGFGFPKNLNQWKQEPIQLKRGEFVEPTISHIYNVTDAKGNTANISVTKKGNGWKYDKIDGNIDFNPDKWSIEPEYQKDKNKVLGVLSTVLNTNIIDYKKIQEAVTDTEVICDNCGWHWSIKDGGNDLYICHKCGHDNTPKSNKTWNLQNGIVSLTKYMLYNGMNISPLPKLKFIDNDKENAGELLGKTAYYNPLEKSITLYTLNRHPKDILRSYAHEMVHHVQNLENRLNNINTTNTNEDGALPEIEEEAYKLGNMMLRNWEDNIKNK
jgi:predicted nucleotidyltransferase